MQGAGHKDGLAILIQKIKKVTAYASRIAMTPDASDEWESITLNEFDSRKKFLAMTILDRLITPNKKQADMNKDGRML